MASYDPTSYSGSTSNGSDPAGAKPEGSDTPSTGTSGVPATIDSVTRFGGAGWPNLDQIVASPAQGGIIGPISVITKGGVAVISPPSFASTVAGKGETFALDKATGELWMYQDILGYWLPTGKIGVSISVGTDGAGNDVVALVAAQKEPMLHAHLLHSVHLVRYAPPIIELRTEQDAPKDLTQRPRMRRVSSLRQRPGLWRSACDRKAAARSI